MVFAQLALLTFLQACVFAPLVVGFVLAYQVTRRFDFTFAGYFVVGAFIPVYAITTAFPIAVACLLSLLLPTAMVLGFERLLYWPLSQRSFGRMRVLVASIGVYAVVENSIAMIFGDASRQVSIALSAQTLHIFSMPITEGLAIGAAIGALTVCACYLAIRFTTLGLLARAVVANSELATVHGTRLAAIYGFALTLSSVLAGVSGAAYSLESYVVPTVGLRPLVMAVVVALATPRLSIRRAILWLLFLLALENLVSFLAGPRWAPIVTYTVFLVLAIAVGRREFAAGNRRL